MTHCIIDYNKYIFSVGTQEKILTFKKNSSSIYDNYIYNCAVNYGVEEYLIKAIIQVESNYNPNVVSKSNAVGLMQIKANTAGRDAYRLKGRIGEPTILDLKDAAINIDLGTAYLSILQKQLLGIINLETRRYAMIVSYVNGLSALLKIFSDDRDYAIEKINALSPEQFFQYVQHYHPSDQAKRYLFKINSTINALHLEELTHLHGISND